MPARIGAWRAWLCGPPRRLGAIVTAARAYSRLVVGQDWITNYRGRDGVLYRFLIMDSLQLQVCDPLSIQVLVEDERRAGRSAASPAPAGPAQGAPAPGVAEESRPFGAVWRLQLEADGRVRLPGAVQAALNVRPGSVLICELDGDSLLMLGPRAAWERVRSRLNLPPASERDLVAELIAERRAEAAREDRDD